MPNTQSAYGLKAVRHQTGGKLQYNPYAITSGYAANIFTGDPVIQVADGSIQAAIGTEGTSSQNAIGVFQGVKYTAANGTVVFSPYWPSGTVATNIEALVYDDPNIVYQVQTGSTGATAVDHGALANISMANAGSTFTGKSAAFLDTSALATTGKAFRIQRVYAGIENTPGAYTNVEVIFAANAIKGVVSAVGGI